MLRVLVVDDNETVARTIKRMLRGRFEVTTRHTGTAAIELITDYARGGHSFDLILCDARMPDLHGWDVLQVARAHMAPSIFIMMSAMDHCDFGADGYLSKPFTLSDFIDTVGHLMPSRASAASLGQWRGPESPAPRSRSFSAPPSG